MGTDEPAGRNRRAERLEQRLAVPVIVAAAVSVPAVFLTTIFDGWPARLGTALNWASLAVLTAESVALFALAGDRMAWVRRHRWPLLITAVAIPAVVLTFAPVQVLRLVLRIVHYVNALRVLRANRIVKAGRVLARRTGLEGWWRHFPVGLGSVGAAVLVALILADPVAMQAHRRVVTEITNRVHPSAALVTGAAVTAALLLLLLRRRRR